ncbi:hypothetical protein M3664_04930 [Paenibacillus lautus]|uniref:hypothetical protein n=1 Tax=Paenibacillus lautus TaxID=1401 RepID=UPI00203E5F97|nr:hypothetical protein [Paenibacillus lautus]MCM3257127.1 hypothetical protein [Paenibacillus lautus]
MAQYVDGRETVLEILKHRIEQGIFDPDTPPVPTIKPGDKDTANLIADLLFAFINQDAYYPHDFEIKAFEDAITVLRPHFEEINYHPKLFIDHLERMRRAAGNE